MRISNRCSYKILTLRAKSQRACWTLRKMSYSKVKKRNTLICTRKTTFDCSMRKVKFSALKTILRRWSSKYLCRSCMKLSQAAITLKALITADCFSASSIKISSITLGMRMAKRCHTFFRSGSREAR